MSELKKILIINFEYPPLGGGGGVATQQMAEELAKDNEVHVITTWFKGLLSEEKKRGVNIWRVRVMNRKKLTTASLLSMVSFVPASLVAGVKVCIKNRFDVINAQFVLPSGLTGLILAKIFRTPFILSFIGGDLYDPTKGTSPHKHWFMRCLVRLIASGADARTAISEDTKIRAQRLHGVKKDIEVVHIGLLRRDFKKKTRGELGFKKDKFLCVSVGRLIPRKGFDTLIEACERVEGVELVIIGGGQEKRRLEEIVQNRGLENRIKILGRVSEKKKWQILGVADVYVSAAKHEGFGIVFLEAMESGLPIVATRVGGQNDFLREGKNALLVSPGDAKGIRNILIKIMKDEEARRMMGENNKREVGKYYLGETTGRFEQVINNVLKKSV